MRIFWEDFRIETDSQIFWILNREDIQQFVTCTENQRNMYAENDIECKELRHPKKMSSSWLDPVFDDLKVMQATRFGSVKDLFVLL